MNTIAERAIGWIRLGNWWAQKIPPVLLLLDVELVRRNASAGESLEATAVLVGCVSCVAAYGHVLNDWCDVRDDALAGKANAMRDLGIEKRAALCASFLVAGFATLAPLADAWPARVVLALNYLWPTLYSIPGIRLKERGLLGVVSDAAGSHVTPTIFAFTVASIFVPGRVDFAITVIAVLWSAALGIKGIVYHQIADRAADEIAGVSTFVDSFDQSRLFAVLGAYNVAVEFPLSVALVVAIASVAPLAIAALVVYLVLESTKYALGFEFAVSSDARLRRRSVPFANEMFSTLWLPLACVAQLAILRPSLAWLVLVHAVVFRDQIAVQTMDTRGLVAQLSVRIEHMRSRHRNR